MLVRDLIKELEKYGQDVEVAIRLAGGGCYSPNWEVRSIGITGLLSNLEELRAPYDNLSYLNYTDSKEGPWLVLNHG